MELNNANIKKAMQQLSDAELVAAIEMGQNAYTPEALVVARQELDTRLLLPEAIRTLAEFYWKDYIRKNLKSILYTDAMLKSEFLEEQTLINCVKAEVENWKARQELFGIDMKAYWGAALI